MNSILDEAGFELRRHAGPVVRISAILVGGLLLILTVIGVIFLVLLQQIRPPADATDSRIPIAAFGYASVQVFDCVRTGPECPQFGQSKDYLEMSSIAGGIEYEPLTDSDPGQANPSGTKTVKFSSDTSDAEYMAFGNAVTLGGKITPTTVFETSFQEGTAERSTVFTYTDPQSGDAVKGTYVFTLTSQQMVLRSVTYEEVA